LGLLSGWLELAMFLLQCRYLDPRNYNASWHFPWMYPVAGLLVLGGPGLVLALAVRTCRRGIPPAVVLTVLGSLAYLGLLFRWPIYTAVCLLLAAGLGYRTARFLAARIERLDVMVVRSLVVMTGLLAATIAWTCAGPPGGDRVPLVGPPAGTPPDTARNVLLIVLDTVRADSLSLYGYHRATTPNLARLASRAVRFERALATAPWTAPSHASMFTGRWPLELSVGWNRSLDATWPTLAEYLAARGYATAGFVANTTYCSYETGLARGFAHYEDYDVSVHAILLCSAVVQRTLNFFHNHPALARWAEQDGPLPQAGHRKDAARISDDFLRWLSQQRASDPERRFFAFLNYYDAHHPYFPPVTGSAEGPTFGRTPGSSAELALIRNWWDLDKRSLAPRDVALAHDAYDRCIVALDRELGRLFAALEQGGLLKETLVVVTADHGEHLGEQKLYGHGCSLYMPELHVPLLVFAPGSDAAGRVVAEPVSLRDLAATVVDQAGVAAGSPFPGSTLARTWSGAKTSTACREPILSMIDAPCEADPNRGTSPVCRGPLRSMVEGRYHYIACGDGREELYDLEDDPDETRNLAGRTPQGVSLGRFRRVLDEATRGDNCVRMRR
jgi:arylsulfatase A-like enzyme